MAWVLGNWTVNYHDQTWDNLRAEIKEIHFMQDLIYDGNYNRELIPKEMVLWIFCPNCFGRTAKEEKNNNMKSESKF